MSDRLIDFIKGCGATTGEATTIVDLAKHAANEAISTAVRITSSAPSDLTREGATMACFRLLQVNLTEHFNEPHADEEPPTRDAYMAACRALHWRTAELKAHGIDPITIPMNAAPYPPDDYDFLQAAKS